MPNVLTCARQGPPIFSITHPSIGRTLAQFDANSFLPVSHTTSWCWHVEGRLDGGNSHTTNKPPTSTRRLVALEHTQVPSQACEKCLSHVGLPKKQNKVHFMTNPHLQAFRLPGIGQSEFVSLGLWHVFLVEKEKNEKKHVHKYNSTMHLSTKYGSWSRGPFGQQHCTFEFSH